jgi:Family of unknown function (DUF6506)
VPDVDMMFLFLVAEIGPAGHRVERVTSTGPAAFLWVPDAETAARVAGEQADAGARIVELYRGFDFQQAAEVVDAVAGRAPIGIAGGAAGPPGRSVTIFGDTAGYGPLVVQHGITSTSLVGVPDEEAAVRAAQDAVAAGADTVEMCGGTALVTAAQVEAAVGNRAAVTLVSWPFESLEGAAAYKAAFEAPR